MDDTSDTAVNVYGNYRSKARSLIVTAVGVLCGLSFFVGLEREPHFVDESAYTSQAYFGDLFVTGDFDSLLWFEYPAYDLPPFTKYLVWAGLVSGGDARPGPAAMRAWYADTSKRFESTDSLKHARTPIALCGLLCVVATGRLAYRWRGMTAAIAAMLLLSIHPLFRSHSRRAMADVPTEMALTVALALFLGIIFDGRRKWLRAIAAGAFVGLAASSKLNGALAGMVIAVWAVMSIARTKALSMGFAAVSGVISIIVFVLINPFFYADPKGLKDKNFAEFESMTVVERMAYVIKHRVDVSGEGQRLFPNDAVRSLPEKASAMLVQGFGRFSPFGPRPDDSRVRFELRQDWPVLIWLPWVLAGAVVAWNDRRSAEHPAGKYLMAYFVVAVVVVGAFLPLAWNRYFLPIVVPSILMAAGAVDRAFERVMLRIRPIPECADG